MLIEIRILAAALRQPNPKIGFVFTHPPFLEECTILHSGRDCPYLAKAVESKAKTNIGFVFTPRPLLEECTILHNRYNIR